MNKIHISHSPVETGKIAGELLPLLAAKKIVCLYGELGSGKTTFVQGLAKALGVKKNIPSPTFILIREYPVKKLPITKLIHVDCYRLESEKDIRAVDLKEFWQDEKNLVVIEWAERIKSILPKERTDLCFEYANTDEKTRKITVFRQ